MSTRVRVRCARNLLALLGQFRATMKQSVVGEVKSICISCVDHEGDQTTPTCPRNNLGPLRGSWHSSGELSESVGNSSDMTAKFRGWLVTSVDRIVLCQSGRRLVAQEG